MKQPFILFPVKSIILKPEISRYIYISPQNKKIGYNQVLLKFFYLIGVIDFKTIVHTMLVKVIMLRSDRLFPNLLAIHF